MSEFLIPANPEEDISESEDEGTECSDQNPGDSRDDDSGDEWESVVDEDLSLPEVEPSLRTHGNSIEEGGVTPPHASETNQPDCQKEEKVQRAESELLRRHKVRDCVPLL